MAMGLRRDVLLRPVLQQRIWSGVLLAVILLLSILATVEPPGRDEKLGPLLDSAALTKAINSGDTAWMMTAATLVLFMIPGLAFFYGGMVS